MSLGLAAYIFERLLPQTYDWSPLVTVGEQAMGIAQGVRIPWWPEPTAVELDIRVYDLADHDLLPSGAHNMVKFYNLAGPQCRTHPMDEGFHWADSFCKYVGRVVLENLRLVQHRIPSYRWAYGKVNEQTSSRLLLPGYAAPLPDVRPDVGGAWRSIGKVSPLHGEDLSQPGALEAAALKRSYRKEIIIMVSNTRGTHLAANQVANFRSVGIEHYLLITNTAQCCQRLMAGPWDLTCGWTSYLLNHPRLHTYQLTKEESAVPFRLWWVRFQFLERLVGLGYNAMYVDTDVSFRVNPYPLFKGPFARYTLFGQDETGFINGINIGFIYVQNALSTGGARRVLNETLMRMYSILEAEEPLRKWDGNVATGAKEVLWDQHIYNDVLESAVVGREMHRRSHQRLIDPANGKRRVWEREQGFPVGGELHFDVETITVLPEDVPTTSDGRKLDLTPGVYKIKTKPLFWYGDMVYLPRQPEDSAPERLVAMPPWLVAGWSGVAGDIRLQGVSGHWNINPPKIAIAHMVGALAKQTTLKSLGWWHYGAETYRDLGLTSLERRLEETGLFAVSGLRTEMMFSDPNRGIAAYGLALSRLIELAVAAGRRPVVPALDCSSPWITRNSNSFLGVMDRLHVIVSTQCNVASVATEGERIVTSDISGENGSLGACCASVDFDCEEGIILQVDMDRDPRWASFREDTAFIKVDELVSAEGKVNATKLKERLHGPKIMTLILGGEDEEGWGARRGIPELDRETLTEHQKAAIGEMFSQCGNLNCVPPRRPWPDHQEPCRQPH